MLTKSYYDSLGLAPVYEKVLAQQRLSAEDGLALLACPDVNAVGALAHHVRTRLHGNNTSYVVNRHINYTNVCVNRCIFCAFRRDDVSQPGAFTLSHDDILTRIHGENKKPLKIDELHIVGGCHPELPLVWFEEILRKVQALCPDLQVKAFTPVEIAHFAQMEQCSTAEVLRRLKDAGLKMMPGGGAEIFDAPLREHICPEKATAEEWLRISGEAHALGILTNATMLYGHLESHAQRVDHLCRLREQQDKSHGFTCFIALPYLTENNSLHLPDEALGPQRGLDQLRTIALSRLMLDNIPHIKAYWVMMGVKMAQSALYYGANDLDGTIVEEKIGHMAGADSVQAMTIAELENMIRHSGFTPLRRNATFQAVTSAPAAPAKGDAA